MQSTNPITTQLIELAEKLLLEEISLREIRVWLRGFPVWRRRYACNAQEQSAFRQLSLMVNRPINVYEWRAFIQELRGNH